MAAARPTTRAGSWPGWRRPPPTSARPASCPSTSSFATGVPALTWQLRGIVQVDVEVNCLERPVHSGDFGGAVPDAVRILCRMLDELRAEDGRIAVPGLYRKVAAPSPNVVRR